MNRSKYIFLTEYDDWLLSYNITAGVLRRHRKESIKKIEDIGLIHENDLLYFQEKSRKMFITIVPTFRCNFRCEYCWESFSEDSISEDTITKILKYVDRKLDVDSTIDELEVSWFGGEALLNITEIIKISEGLKSIADIKGVRFSQLIATNGFLFTKELQEKLLSCNFRSAVITLDGGPEVHNTRRHLEGGQPTFDVILKNIKDTVFEKIDVGVNCDFYNESEISVILDYLESVKSKIMVYFRWVFPKVEKWDEYYNSEEYRLKKMYIHKKLIEYNWMAVKRGFLIRNPLFRRAEAYCKSDTDNHIIIGPMGEIYKCNVEMNDKISYGDLDEYGVISNVNTNKKIMWQQSIVKKTMNCDDCMFLSVCFGGCNYAYMKSNRNKCVFLSAAEAIEYIKMQYYCLEKRKVKASLDG